MPNGETSLAALIGSRICHDLISPIGAINNGLELLGMAGASDGPELDLISESVGNASARIRFFRVAYGAAGAQDVGRSEIESILHDLTQGSRLDVAYGPVDPQPRAQIKAVFLALQCLETAMAHGGRVEISLTDGRWQLAGFAARIAVEPALWDRLHTAPTQELAPAHVQFALLPLILDDLGRRATVRHDPDRCLTVAF